MEKQNNIELFIVALLSSIVLSLASIFFLVDEVKDIFPLLQGDLRTRGLVFEIVKGYSSEDSTNSYKIGYNVAGKSYAILRKEPDLFGIDRNYEIGDTVELIYSRNEPKVARVYSFEQIYVPIIASVLFVVFSIVLLILTIKKKKWLMKNEGGPWSHG